MTKEEKKAYQKSYHAAYWKLPAVRAAANKRSRFLRREHRELVKNHKEAAGCADCRNKYPHYVMDFDHVLPGKIDTVSRMSGSGTSLARLKAEIAKCEVVCSNCHRIRTFTRREQGIGWVGQ